MRVLNVPHVSNLDIDLVATDISFLVHPVSKREALYCEDMDNFLCLTFYPEHLPALTNLVKALMLNQIDPKGGSK